MEQIFEHMLSKAVRDLNALAGRKLVEFKVITADGGEFGSLEVAQKKATKRSPPSYPRNEMRDYVLQYLKNLGPDEIASIPTGKYDPELVRGNACSWCSVHWGKGTYTSTKNLKNSTVEIYRHATE